MNAEYLLTQLVRAGRKMRQKQKQYYSIPGPVRDNPIKSATLQESKQREQEFDRLLVEIDKVHRVPDEA